MDLIAPSSEGGRKVRIRPRRSLQTPGSKRQNCQSPRPRQSPVRSRDPHCRHRRRPAPGGAIQSASAGRDGIIGVLRCRFNAKPGRPPLQAGSPRRPVQLHQMVREFHMGLVGRHDENMRQFFLSLTQMGKEPQQIPCTCRDTPPISAIGNLLPHCCSLAAPDSLYASVCGTFQRESCIGERTVAPSILAPGAGIARVIAGVQVIAPTMAVTADLMTISA
jgi:hypothetical protein